MTQCVRECTPALALLAQVSPLVWGMVSFNLRVYTAWYPEDGSPNIRSVAWVFLHFSPVGGVAAIGVDHDKGASDMAC